MRTDLYSCLGHLQNGCEATAHSLLVLMPHEQTHGASSILKQIGMLSPGDSSYAEILRDNIADAQECPSYGSWAGGIVKRYCRLGMASLFLSSGIIGLNSLGFQANMKGQLCKVGMVCMCPQGNLPPKGPSSAHVLHGFCAPVQMKTVPYFEILMPIPRLQLLIDTIESD